MVAPRRLGWRAAGAGVLAGTLAIAAAVVSCSLAGTKTKTATAAPSAAAVFVSTSGSDSNSCSQSAPCASLNRAYQVAHPGDTIEVAAGSYGPQQVLQTVPPKAAPAVIFKAAEGTRPVLAGLFLGTNNGSPSGTSPSNVTFDGFEVNGRFTTIYPCLCPPAASNITLQNSWIHAWDSVGGLVELDDVSNAKILNNEIGPLCCQSDGIETGLRPGSTSPKNMLIEGNYVHDLFDSCATPEAAAFAGKCKGTGYGDGCGGCDHVDGFQASGLDGATFRGNRFYNAGTQGIFLAPANGGSFANITLENNMVGAVNHGGNNDVSLSGPCFGCYSGTILIRNNTVQKVLSLYAAGNSQRVFAPGTVIRVVDNIIGDYSSSNSGRNCSLVYSDGSPGQITYSHNLFSFLTCGPTDIKGTATFVSSNPAAPDLHLERGSKGLGAGDPAASFSTDFDGDVRPQRQAADIGADQRETAAIQVPRSIGRTVLGMKEADVVAFYGHPRRIRRYRSVQGVQRVAFYNVHHASLWITYDKGVVVGVGSNSTYYQTSKGLGSGADKGAVLAAAGVRWNDCFRSFRRVSGGVSIEFVPTGGREGHRIASLSFLRHGYEPLLPEVKAKSKSKAKVKPKPKPGACRPHWL